MTNLTADKALLLDPHLFGGPFIQNLYSSKEKNHSPADALQVKSRRKNFALKHSTTCGDQMGRLTK